MRKRLNMLFWPILYVAFVAAAYALRTQLTQSGASEVWGWDYGTFVGQINDWKWISYTGFRHPGLGLVMSPLVALQHLWSDAYLWFMPAVAVLTAGFVRRLGGWGALGIWLAMPTTWILAGTPESFPVAQLLLAVSVCGLASRRLVVLFAALNGLVTVTNGVKPVLAWMVSRARKRDVLLLAGAGLAALAVGIAFFAVRAEMNGKDWMAGIRGTLTWIPSERHLGEELKGFFMRPIGWIGLVAYPLALRGAWLDRGLAKTFAGFFVIDFVIHLLVGWGMGEPWVFAPHWIWMLAVLSGKGMKIDGTGWSRGIYCPGFGDATNGMSVLTRYLLSDSQWKNVRIVHGGWLVGSWWACLRNGNYVRMPHGSYDPVRLAYHGWKKWLVGPIERFFLRRATKVLVTCAAEADWVRAYEPRVKAVEIVDVKKYFGIGGREGLGSLEGLGGLEGGGDGVHLLYLGRRHPLKGVEYLERAAKEIGSGVELRIVSNARGEEKEKVWKWCDVLCLPTLSENFGLVVAEALERGKRVIVTDGAPAWEPEEIVRLFDCSDCSIAVAYGGRLLYVRGYREGDAKTRVELLKSALQMSFRPTQSTQSNNRTIEQFL